MDNARRTGLNTSPTTLDPLIPKNQKKCKNKYAMIMAPSVFPKLNNGICKNLNKISCRFPYEVKSANQFATMKNVRITKLGISASNDFTTVGGTPSGI